jgi:hypothetical protein
LGHFMAFGIILRPFGIFYAHWVYFKVFCFSPFWYVAPRKIWQPCTYSDEMAQFAKTGIKNRNTLHDLIAE